MSGRAGRFEIAERVGQGAMGEVHRAIDTRDGSTVALKILRQTSDDSDARERFVREARMMARISSPHVARYIDHGALDDGRLYLAVEWLEGVDLSRRHRMRQLTPHEALDAVRQAALGVAAIHAEGIVHRDLKPSNLFVTEDDGAMRVRVIDLGVARSAEEATITGVGTMIGTPSYMAPEQIVGAQSVSVRCDVFALGVVLFELLAGRRPYLGDHPMTIVAKIALEDPPRLSSVLSAVPAPVDDLVARAMAKEPRARLESAALLAAELGHVLGSLPRTPLAPIVVDGDEGDTMTHATPSLVLSERRVVTAIFVALSGPEEVEAQFKAFESFMHAAGGAAYRLLHLGLVGVFGQATTTGTEVERAALAALSLAKTLRSDGDLAITTGSLADAPSVLGAPSLLSDRPTVAPPRATEPPVVPRVSVLPGEPTSRRATFAPRVAIVTARMITGTGVLSGDAIEEGTRLLERLGTGHAHNIAIDEDTERLLGDGFETEVLDGVRRLLRQRHSGSADRLFLGAVRPCVGRDRELAQLEALYDEVVEDGVSRAALVVGRAGSGKSRLRMELVKRLEKKESAPLVLLGRASAMAESAAYALVGSAFRYLAGIQDGEDREAQREKLMAALGVGRFARTRRKTGRPPETERFSSSRPPPAEGPLLPMLAQIAAIDERVAAFGADRVAVSDRLREAFERWLDAASLERPIVFVLEDVHWADKSSIELVRGALANLPERRVFVLALARPEVEGRYPHLFDAALAQSFTLSKLSRRAATELARSVLGDAVPTALVERIVEQADGNAFFLEELIRAARDAVDSGANDAPLPATIMGVMQARLDGLGAHAKRIVKAAAVYGDAFWPHAVNAVLGEDDPRESASAIEVLVTNEIFVRRSRSRAIGHDELAFRHALLRDAAYELLGDGDRALAHRRAATWLEGSPIVDPYSLALHLDRGHVPERARTFYRAAAEQALFGSDFDAALRCGDRAIELGASEEDAGMIHLLLAEASRWSGGLERAYDEAVAAHPLLRRGSAPYFHAIREAIAAAGRLGMKDVTSALADVALDAIAEDEPAQAARLAAIVPSAVHALYGGDSVRAGRYYAAIEALADRVEALHPLARARVHQVRAVFAGHHDELERSIAEQRLAVAAFEEANDLRGVALASSNCGFALLSVGALEEAELLLHRALELAARLSLKTIQPLATQNLAILEAHRGHWDAAIRRHTDAAAVFRAQKDPRLEGSSLAHLALLYARRGDRERARDVAGEVLITQFDAMKVGALAALALVALGEGDAREAVLRADEAMSLLATVGAVEEFDVVAHAARAEIYAAVDDARLDEALRESLAFVSRRAERLVDPLARRAFLETIPEHARIMALAHHRGLTVA